MNKFSYFGWVIAKDLFDDLLFQEIPFLSQHVWSICILLKSHSWQTYIY